jgi:hypothetical protein
MDGEHLSSFICDLPNKMFDPKGKYVGNRPVKLRKADSAVRPVEIGHRKAKQLDQDRKNKGKRKPY